MNRIDDTIASLAAIASESTTVQQCDSELHRWLEREVGCDLVYRGGVMRDHDSTPTTSGVDPDYVRRCEEQHHRYWCDRDLLHDLTRRSGDLAVDTELLSAQRRGRLALYAEVMRDLGVRTNIVALLRFRSVPIACLYLGRTTSSRPTSTAMERLRASLPVLALVEAAREAPIARPPSGALETDRSKRGREPGRRLTSREQQVLHYVSRGLTNHEIASTLGTSPATVKNQIARLFEKADVSNRTELAMLAQTSEWLWPA